MLQHHRCRAAMLLCLLATAVGCAETGDQPQAEGTEDVISSASIAQFITWGDTITLEENSDVINVDPTVTVDSAGNFVVADKRESQVRLYNSTGKLLSYFGGKGGGPEEFASIVGAMRRRSGETIVIDATGKVAVFPPNSKKVSRTFRLPVAYIWEADLVGDDRLLVAGRLPGPGGPSPRLHLIDLESASILNSFFPPPPTAVAGKPIERNVGFVGATVYGDTIAAVYSVSDTVYLFDQNGTALSKIPLRSDNFRRIETAPPPRGSNMKDLLAWVSTFSLMINAFPTPEGNFVVQFHDRNGMDVSWRLAGITRDGEVLFDFRDTPRLLTPSADGSDYWFISPNSETPNQWVSASLSR
jgi:hypothetical protein